MKNINDGNYISIHPSIGMCSLQAKKSTQNSGRSAEDAGDKGGKREMGREGEEEGEDRKSVTEESEQASEICREGGWTERGGLE